MLLHGDGSGLLNHLKEQTKSLFSCFRITTINYDINIDTNNKSNNIKSVSEMYVLLLVLPHTAQPPTTVHTRVKACKVSIVQ